MAQVTGGSDFNSQWERKCCLVLNLLITAADEAVRLGQEANQPDHLLAAVLRVFALPKVYLMGPLRNVPMRPLHEWRGELKRPAEEGAALWGRASSARIQAVLESLRTILRNALDQWSQGTRAEALVKEVMDDMIEILFREKMVPRPPSRLRSLDDYIL